MYRESTRILIIKCWKLGGITMKKTILILTLVAVSSYTSLASAITYDSSKEIIERIQLETKHK